MKIKYLFFNFGGKIFNFGAMIGVPNLQIWESKKTKIEKITDGPIEIFGNPVPVYPEI